MPTSTTPEAAGKGFVFVEDGQDGIKVRFFFSRTGAEAALTEAGLEYQTGGQPLFTQEQMVEHIRLMREAEERQEHYVVECLSIGSLWIDVVDLEA